MNIPKPIAKMSRINLLITALLAVSCVLWLAHGSLGVFRVSQPLPFHTILEAITATIFTSVFFVGWNAFGDVRKKSSVILAVAFLCAAILGLLHAICFMGMPGFSSAADMHKSLSFWLASRAIIAATLFGLAFDPVDSEISHRDAWFLLLAGLGITAAWAAVIFFLPGLIPLTYLADEGQTSFKVACETGLIAMNVLTAYLFYRHVHRHQNGQSSEHLNIERGPLYFSAALMAMSEVYFSLYAETSDVNIVIGHLFQLLAAFGIYRSIVAINIHQPYAKLAETTSNLARSAEELNLQKQRLKRMIDTAIDGILTVDEQQTIIQVNPAAAHIFGYDSEALIGSSLNNLIPLQHRHKHAAHVRQFGKAGITRRKMGSHFEDFYVTGCRASGEEFPIEASIAHQIEDGQRYYTVIFRDITDRKLAKENMARYHEQLSQLSNTLQTIREEERKHIARELHDDLGQLLAALRMDLSMLQRDPSQSQVNLQTLGSMDQLLLTSITTLRRIATDLRPRALDEGGLFFALQTLQKDFASRHRMQCELLADEELLKLDDQRSTAIFRIIQESLTNVARHSEASEVRIEFARAADLITFTISDNGKGIDENDMKKSQSFGLVGMRERIKALHGDFSVYSEEGDGTTLEIRIPLENASN